MSFASDAKIEVLKEEITSDCCAISFLSALIKCSGQLVVGAIFLNGQRRQSVAVIGVLVGSRTVGPLGTQAVGIVGVAPGGLLFPRGIRIRPCSDLNA